MRVAEFFGVRIVESYAEGFLLYLMKQYLESYSEERMDFTGVAIHPDLVKSGLGVALAVSGVRLDFCGAEPVDSGIDLGFLQMLPTLPMEFADGVCAISLDAYDRAVGDYTFISSLAQLLVRAYLEGIDIGGVGFRLVMTKHFWSENLCDIYVLENYGNALFRGRIDYPRLDDFKSSKTPQLEWVSFLRHKHFLCKMCRDYTAKEKLAELRNRGIEVGDAVLLYEAAKWAESKVASRLLSVRIAVVREIDERRNQIKLSVCNFHDTFAHRHFMLHEQEMPEELQGSPYFDAKSERERFSIVDEIFSLYNIGVCDAMRKETTFILEPFIYDSFSQMLYTKSSWECVETNTLDTIYIALENRHVKWNANKFAMKYLGGSPVYEGYRQWNDCGIREEFDPDYD